MKAELITMKGGYMSRKLFNSSVPSDLQYKIQTSFPEPDWDWARAHNDYRNTISMSAINLSLRIKDELGLDVFPLIITVAIKGYASDGQMKFQMLGKKKGEIYYFDYPASHYSKKSKKLYLDSDGTDQIISLRNSNSL